MATEMAVDESQPTLALFIGKETHHAFAHHRREIRAWRRCLVGCEWGGGVCGAVVLHLMVRDVVF